PFVVAVQGEEGLQPVPYTERWPEQMAAAATALRQAAAAAPEEEAALRAYLQAAASAFQTNDWFAADQAWAAGRVSDPSIRVAILDTGIDFLHRELEGLVDLESSASFVEGEPDIDDHHFHGTHVASTVATNSVTIAGIAPHSTLIAVKVLSFQGSGTFEGVIGGIVHAADVDAHVINMSLGAQFDRRLEGARELIEATRRGVKYAEKAGTIVISAAGNSETNLDDAGAPIVALPCMVSTVCVAATGPLNGQFDENGPIVTANHDQPAYYTNYGLSAIHVAAPGGNANPDDPDQAQGTWRDEDLIVGALAGRCLSPGLAPFCTVNNQPLVNFYVFAAGTSMAAPHVSGAAAMIQAAHGGVLSVDEVFAILTGTADDVGEPGPDPFSNHGRINVLSAVTH
ncbi:MAG: S8 family serine peptidase, partial [Gemmatimonadetes bacterium]|nr:S8 family serine peptidase [Gemmatimonadota bacterium]